VAVPQYAGYVSHPVPGIAFGCMTHPVKVAVAFGVVVGFMALFVAVRSVVIGVLTHSAPIAVACAGGVVIITLSLTASFKMRATLKKQMQNAPQSEADKNHP
jgi:hypothetical protein